MADAIPGGPAAEAVHNTYQYDIISIEPVYPGEYGFE
jgi:hypothetical protein